MKLSTRPLEKKDIPAIVTLDKQWFGDHGITASDLNHVIAASATSTLGLFQEEKLVGFAIMEVVEADRLPSDYVGTCQASAKTLFIQQFTTTSNYQIDSWRLDAYLLEKIEKLARSNKCSLIGEALSIEHPYSKVNNPRHDVYGFYESQGYHRENCQLRWQPSAEMVVPCILIVKKLD